MIKHFNDEYPAHSIPEDCPECTRCKTLLEKRQENELEKERLLKTIDPEKYNKFVPKPIVDIPATGKKQVVLDIKKVNLVFGKTCFCEDSEDDMDYTLHDIISTPNVFFPYCQRCGEDFFLVSCVYEFRFEKSTVEDKIKLT